MILNNEQGKKLSGFFMGKVVKHLSQGMCKVYIPGVYPPTLEKEPDKLPDALQVAPMFGGSFKGNGVFSYPNLGSTVMCGFLNEDQNRPIYWGVIQGGEDASNQYGEARCEITEDSQKSGDDARVHKISVDKATVKFYESGKIEIKTFKDRKYATSGETPEVGCHIDINENGTLNIYTSSQIQLKTPEIAIDTKNFKLQTQTARIDVSDGLQVTTKKNTKIVSLDNLDVISRTESHINRAFSLTTAGEVNINGEYVGMTGKTHPPIFL